MAKKIRTRCGLQRPEWHRRRRLRRGDRDERALEIGHHGRRKELAFCAWRTED
jgi:hypothetical protein